MPCSRRVLFQTEHRQSQCAISGLLTLYASVQRREVCQILDSTQHCQYVDTLWSSVGRHPTVVSTPTNRNADCYSFYNVEQHDMNVNHVANYTAWSSCFTLSNTWQTCDVQTRAFRHQHTSLGKKIMSMFLMA
jgi:hypothetical protein